MVPRKGPHKDALASSMHDLVSVPGTGPRASPGARLDGGPGQTSEGALVSPAAVDCMTLLPFQIPGSNLRLWVRLQAFPLPCLSLLNLHFPQQPAAVLCPLQPGEGSVTDFLACPGRLNQGTGRRLPCRTWHSYSTGRKLARDWALLE